MSRLAQFNKLIAYVVFACGTLAPAILTYFGGVLPMNVVVIAQAVVAAVGGFAVWWVKNEPDVNALVSDVQGKRPQEALDLAAALLKSLGDELPVEQAAWKAATGKSGPPVGVQVAGDVHTFDPAEWLRGSRNTAAQLAAKVYPAPGDVARFAAEARRGDSANAPSASVSDPFAIPT